MPRQRQTEGPATVSVCVTPHEQLDIRRAATLADLTVSGWLYARTMNVLASTKSRALIKSHRPEPTKREARVSMVMPRADHDALVNAAGALSLPVHTLAQSIALAAAAREVAPVTPDRLEMVDNLIAGRLTPRPVTFAVRVPSGERAAAKGLDLDALATLVGLALNQVGDQVFAGNGQVIHDGMARSFARMEAAPGKWVEIGLPIPEVEWTIASRILRLPVATVATALVVKAAKAL